MPIKLGEMLVKAGLVTPAALDDALKSQVIFGGKLGTNLIEMGCLDEEELARMLSRQLRVAYVDPRELMEVPPEVISLIPEEMAESYRLVPLRLEGRRLSIAMADPSDLPAIDEIAFRTGYVVQPMVTPEIRLIAALEKYYGIKREIRYLPVSKELGGRRVCSYQATPADVVAASPREVVDFSALEGSEADFYPWSGEGGEAARAEALERCGVDAVSQELADARDRDAVAAALVGWGAGLCERAALCVVAGEMVKGWEAYARGERLERFDELRIGLDEPSVFQTVVRDRGIFLGAAPETPANRRFFDALGGAPRGVLLVPMVMKRRVVAVLCAADDPDRLGAGLEQFRSIARKGIMAFEILILRNKILMT
ncbi:general secretion pathway protein GspE [Geobacter sp.]|uniref:GspE/PulE/PilB domain-containing protein n=1 Tax=Geobacter sp. TaxID=46610 RepID=UPI0026288FD8|nr:general secretion pathway protein GspE [Geobacter sp.]